MTPIESAEAFADGAMAADNLESPAVLAKRLWAQLESAHELAEEWLAANEAEFLSGALADEVSSAKL